MQVLVIFCLQGLQRHSKGQNLRGLQEQKH
jgi:hypothetical protein